LSVVPGLPSAAAADGKLRRSTGSGAPGAARLDPLVISIDGSSTVFPIVEAAAEQFRARNAAPITIGVSGTGGGFKKLCNAEIAISGASRPVHSAEAAACQAHGVQYLELPIAYDGITVVVHPDNHWATELTVAELAALWRPEAQLQVQRWSQIRSGWPDAEIHLLGPGVDSGTYDYFTLAIVGREHASRGDYSASEDDHLIARGVSRDPLALGFFGYAYYAENRALLRPLGIDEQRQDNGRGAVLPTPETVRDGSYSPLSRPVFLYVSLEAAARPEVEAFVRFCLEQAGRLVEEVGYVALSEDAYLLARRRFEARVVGSLFGAPGSRSVSVESLLAAE
jgi:phosphate transport system substrate-binding protein